jgi:hypothetical protein
VHGVSPLTKEVLAKRTQDYQQWVEAFARNHRIPIEWPDAEPLKTKKLKKEVLPGSPWVTTREPSNSRGRLRGLRSWRGACSATG